MLRNDTAVAGFKIGPIEHAEVLGSGAGDADKVGDHYKRTESSSIHH